MLFFWSPVSRRHFSFVAGRKNGGLVVLRSCFGAYLPIDRFVGCVTRSKGLRESRNDAIEELRTRRFAHATEYGRVPGCWFFVRPERREKTIEAAGDPESALTRLKGRQYSYEKQAQITQD